MYKRFTDRARGVMRIANREALALGCEYIGTEHVLLGIVIEGSGLAAEVLKRLQINTLMVAAELHKMMQLGGGPLPQAKLYHTPRTKTVIEHAIKEARNLGHNWVGTEHLLLGLIQERDGIAGQTLINLGADLQKVRNELLTVLGHVPENPEAKMVVSEIVAMMTPPKACPYG